MFFNIDNQIQNAGQVNGNTLLNPALSPFRAVMTGTSECAAIGGCSAYPYQDQNGNWVSPANSNQWNHYHNTDITFQTAKFIERNILNAQPVDCAGGNGLCNKTSTTSGPDLICTTGQYQLINLPSGVTIQWQIQNGYFKIDNGQGTPIINITKLTTGNDIIKVTLTNTCGASLVITKSIHGGGYGSGDYPVSGPSTTGCNAYVTYTINQLAGATNYAWFYPGNWTYISGQGTYTLTLLTNSSSMSNTYQIGVRVANTCDAGGSPGIKMTSFQGCSGFAIAASPNPSTGTVDVSTVQAKDASVTNTKTNKIYKIMILDKVGNIMKQINYAGVANTRINLGSLISGSYTIKAFNGTEWSSQQIIISR